jgi:hypothetical protein
VSLLVLNKDGEGVGGEIRAYADPVKEARRRGVGAGGIWGHGGVAHVVTSNGGVVPLRS